MIHELSLLVLARVWACAACVFLCGGDELDLVVEHAVEHQFATRR